MKKILLTTTALTLIAGAAAAGISLSGSGRMGIQNLAGTVATSTRVRINFNASGETDGGLTFGTWTRLNMGNGAGALQTSGSALWLGNGTATLTIGNTVGGVAKAAGTGASGLGFTGSGWLDGINTGQTTNSSGGNGPNVVRVDFALGSANISVSGGNTNATEAGVNFTAGSAKIGVGYIASGAGAGSGVSVAFDAGSANIRVQAGTYGGASRSSVRVDYGMGSGTLSGFVSSLAGVSNYGIGYAQGLGGGATVKGSVVSAGGTVNSEIGINFSF